MPLLYTEDKPLIQTLTKRLGDPHAKYFDLLNTGKYLGVSWHVSKTTLRKLSKLLRQAQKLVEIV